MIKKGRIKKFGVEGEYVEILNMKDDGYSVSGIKKALSRLKKTYDFIEFIIEYLESNNWDGETFVYEEAEEHNYIIVGDFDGYNLYLFNWNADKFTDHKEDRTRFFCRIGDEVIDKWDHITGGDN